MARFMRQVKTFSGALVGLAISLIVLFFLLNIAQTRGGFLAPFANAVFKRASGEAYEGSEGVAASQAVSAYSYANNMGPQL